MRLTCLAILVFLMGMTPARADIECAPRPDLVAPLLRWIGDHTDYDITQSLAAPPRISFCETGQIIHYEDRDVIVETGLRAAYDLTHQQIFLVRPWSAQDTFDLSVLLHELIHHVQLQNRSWDCIGAPEWEAYKLQEKWLKAHDIDPEFDWLTIYMMSRCPRDIHPD